MSERFSEMVVDIQPLQPLDIMLGDTVNDAKIAMGGYTCIPSVVQ